MMRRTCGVLRRIAYLTDVEGDVAYLECFVASSQALRWESRDGQLCAAAFSGLPNAVPASAHATLTVADLRQRYQLGFTDDETDFVYGGDAFDHGADLSVAQALLDLKRRYPQRVHLILGNRDLNKMIMAPMAALSGALRCCQTPFAQHMSADEQGDFLFPARLRSTRPGGVSYGAFLAASANKVQPSPVSMVKWALQYKLGSPHAFEYRRRELARLRADGYEALVTELVQSPFLKPPSSLMSCDAGPTSQREVDVTDGEVASSFFRAAQPGGAYYEYMRLGLLSKCLHGILFVHGGLTEQNLGVIPATSATVPQAHWERVGPLAEPAQWQRASDADANATSLAADADAHDWLRALAHFKDVCWGQWDAFWWSAPIKEAEQAHGEMAAPVVVAHSQQDLRTRTGEPLRTYVFPREAVPYSITVASPIHLDGPSYAALPVVDYLLSSGVRVVCAGHQPAGELPAVVRQPPADCFFTITGDTSYCGSARAAHLCTPENQRAQAVAEILFTVDDDGAADAPVGSVRHILIHGRDALGVPFAFDVMEDPLVGTGLPDQWWVRRCHRSREGEASTCEADATEAAVPTSDKMYELVRTTDGFRTVSSCTITADALRARCAEATRQRSQQPKQQVGGVLKDRYTKTELAEVRVHRIKTKVSPSKGI